MIDDDYMRQAIEMAKRNPDAPFGAILVERNSGEVVATGVNQASSNPAMHGEIAAIFQYATHGAGCWEDLILFTTAEPCCMCQAAIVWAAIPRVVFGTSVAKLRSFGWQQFQMTANDIVKLAPFSQCEIVGGVLEETCDDLFRAGPKGRT